MLLHIPGNNIFKINIQNKIICQTHIQPKINKNKITIVLYDKEYTVDLEWLFLYAWFEFDYSCLKYGVENILFFELNTRYVKSKSGVVPYFKRPIYDERIKNARVIPCAPKYVMKSNGDVYKRGKDSVINKPLKRSEGASGHQRVHITTRDNNGRYQLHRLVGITWLPQRNHIDKPIINHIDGDPTNNHFKNLEWCTFSHNSEHSLKTGNNRASKCLMRDSLTGEIKEFLSLNQAAKSIGCQSGHLYSPGNENWIFKRRYEVRLMDDDRPWTIPIGELKQRRRGHEITVTKPNGEKELFTNCKKFRDAYKCPKGSEKVVELVKRARIAYPDHTFECRNLHALGGATQAYNINTKEMFSSETHYELANLLGVRVTQVLAGIKRGETKARNGWSFRLGTSNRPWADAKEIPEPFPSIEVTDLETGEVKVYDRISLVAKEYDCSISAVRNRCLNPDKVFGKFVFKYIVN